MDCLKQYMLQWMAVTSTHWQLSTKKHLRAVLSLRVYTRIYCADT